MPSSDKMIDKFILAEWEEWRVLGVAVTLMIEYFGLHFQI